MLSRFLTIIGLTIALMSQGFAIENQTRFENKVVIVTGASKGIGKGIAKLFAKEKATVILVARNQTLLEEVEKEITLSGGKACCMQGDVSAPEDMEKIVFETVEQFGKVDVLCHNAGVYPVARLEDMSLEQWQSVIDINLTGTFLAVKACLPQMIEQGHGKIVITSSISGPRTGLPGVAHYTASKGGVNGFIKTAAIELAKYNINVNAVEPGNILTEGLEELGESHINSMLKAIPMGRIGKPEDIAGATLFLASEDADFITGQSIVVDGGQVLPESHYDEY